MEIKRHPFILRIPSEFWNVLRAEGFYNNKSVQRIIIELVESFVKRKEKKG